MSTRLPDVALSRNTRWDMELQLYQDPKRTVPFDLTGYTVQSQLRSAESLTSALLVQITAMVTDAAAGKITISLSAAQIAAITASEGWADVLIGAAGADPDRICYFKAVIGDGETEWT